MENITNSAIVSTSSCRIPRVSSSVASRCSRLNSCRLVRRLRRGSGRPASAKPIHMAMLSPANVQDNVTARRCP